jgi:hypothetical protein
MSLDIRLRDLYRERDNYFRITEFRTGTGQFQLVSPALDNKKPLHARFRSAVPTYIFTESYVKVTTDKLRQIDGNRDLQRQFVLENLVAYQESNLLVFLKVLLKEGEKFSGNFVSHIIDILSAPENTIIIPPLLYNFKVSKSGRLIPTAPVEPQSYLDFLRELLGSLSSQGIKQVGINVPSNIPRSSVPEILALFKDFDTPTAILDANGKTNVDSFLIQRSLVGIGSDNSYNLRQKQDEKYMLYSFDSKPYRGRGDIVPAMNVLQLDSGFSTFGSRHTIRMKPPPTPPPGVELPSRILYNQEYSYYKTTVPDAIEAFKHWREENNIQDQVPLRPQIERYKRDYEYLGLSESIGKLYEYAGEGTLDKELSSHQHITKILERIKKNNKKMLS